MENGRDDSDGAETGEIGHGTTPAARGHYWAAQCGQERAVPPPYRALCHRFELSGHDGGDYAGHYAL